MTDEPDPGLPIGKWRVLDPDGNVLAEGDGAVLEAATDFGNGEEEQ